MEEPLPDQEQPDILILAVVSDEQASQVGKRLVEEGFRYTIISAASALLPAGSACLMVGTHSSRLERFNSVVDQICRTRRTFIPAHTMVSGGMPPMMIEAQVGSASVYVLPLDGYLIF